MDHKLEKWISWIKVIQGELESLIIAKDVFWSVQDLIKTNPEIQKESIFYWYMGNTYVAYALTAIRRQVKHDKQSISLAQLLAEIAQEPEKVSRKYYRSLYTGHGKGHFADRHFDRFCQTPGDPHISQALVQRDLNELNSSATGCEDFTDKRIAHRDKRTPKRLPKFGEADNAIETLHQLCLKYRLMLLADSQTTLLPTYQYDWQEIFDYPWRRRE